MTFFEPDRIFTTEEMNKARSIILETNPGAERVSRMVGEVVDKAMPLVHKVFPLMEFDPVYVAYRLEYSLLRVKGV
jgi:hypothetical protein